jgi:hypothetical protein
MEIKNLWPTTILLDEVTDKELLNSVVTYIYSNDSLLSIKEKSDKSIIDFPELSDLKNKIFIPAFDKYLQETCNKSLKDWNYKLNSWLIRQSLNYHNHGNSQLSAVLYLISDEGASGGDIYFTDPRQNANRGYDSNFQHLFKPFSFKPKCGHLVVFPSFLYHYVTTYQSNIRMAIPVDCFLHPHLN